MPLAASPHDNGRIAALDAARALGVVAMVVGHTLDAVLAPELRDATVLATYWKARGLTAPIFFVTAGWAATVAIRRSGREGLAVVRGRLPRVLLLLAIGYTLRWPGWATELLRAGDRATWAHFLAFDALHAIALSLLVAALVLALPWTVREKALAFALLSVLAVALGMEAPLPFEDAALPAAPAAIALAQVRGGTSTFPLFPWAAYFFAGTLLGLAGGHDTRQRATWMAIAGGALVLATSWTGVGAMPSAHPVLVAFRIGAVLIVLSALSAIPAAAAARLAPLGRASLGVYAVHVAIVYGWSTHEGLLARVGQTLPLGRALLAAAWVLAASLAVTIGIRAALGAARAVARARRERAGALLPAPARLPRGRAERERDDVRVDFDWTEKAGGESPWRDSQARGRASSADGRTLSVSRRSG